MAQDGDRPEFLDLIGHVYDAALHESLWAGLAPEITRFMGSPSAGLRVQSQTNQELLSQSANFNTAWIEAYQTYYYGSSTWVERGAKYGVSDVGHSGKGAISDRDLEETEVYQDRAYKAALFNVVGSLLELSPDEISVLGGVHRPHDSSTFEDDNEGRVYRFLLHLQRALQIRGRLAGLAIAARAALDALQRSGTATLVLTRDGRILYANHMAESVFRERIGISGIGGRLTTDRRATTDRLLALIRNAVDIAAGSGTSPVAALAIEREDRLPLTVLVAPFRPARDGFGAGVPAAIAFIRDPESTVPTTLALRGLFGLTPAEAGIASALAEGKSVNDISAQQGITLNTTRVHLKSIFAKTGTARQAQLVALILRSVAAMRSSA